MLSKLKVQKPKRKVGSERELVAWLKNKFKVEEEFSNLQALLSYLGFRKFQTFNEGDLEVALYKGDFFELLYIKGKEKQLLLMPLSKKGKTVREWLEKAGISL